MSSATGKLRDSCNACAMSKIKCPKERPSCSRCESRNVTCHYSFTKRPGRKPENGSSARPSAETITVAGTPRNDDGNGDGSRDHDGSHSGNVDQLARQTSHPSLDALLSSMTPGSTTGSNTNANANGYLGITPTTRQPSPVSSPGLEDAHAQADSSDIFSMLSDIPKMHSMHDIHTPPDLDGFDEKMVDFLESSIKSHFALPTPDNSNSTAVTPTGNDIASLLMPAGSTSANMCPGAPSASDTGSTSSSSISSWLAPEFSTSSTLSLLSTSSAPSMLLQFPGIADSSSSRHLAQTIDILKTLSSAQSSRLAGSAGPHSPSSDADAFTKAVLGENQQSIDAISTILSSSSCDGDGFLLAVLSMTVLKMLERYDAAALAQPIDSESDLDPRVSNGLMSYSTGPDHRRTTSTPALRHDDSGRETVAAKLVLGELHRVQRLVNELSRAVEKHNQGGDNPAMKADGMKPAKLLVTASTLSQLETDMRKSLSALSTDIIERLRQRY